MFLSGSANTLLDNAVTSLTGQGAHVTVAAGNSNSDMPSSTRAPVS
jgi:cerevisin